MAEENYKLVDLTKLMKALGPLGPMQFDLSKEGQA